MKDYEWRNKKIKMSNRYCTYCGSIIENNYIKCPECNRNIYQDCGWDVVTANGKSRIIAIILTFFVGMFGIHKFYLNKPVSGVLYLLFSWTLIPYILSIIDLIYLVSISNDTFFNKYE